MSQESVALSLEGMVKAGESRKGGRQRSRGSQPKCFSGGQPGVVRGWRGREEGAWRRSKEEGMRMEEPRGSRGGAQR